jgi:thiamine biosynthesis protein ThiC
VFVVLFASDIATSWLSYECLVSTGANWEQAGSDFETFHSGINRERIPMAARIDTASSIFSLMAESVHAFSKPNDKASTILPFFLVFLTGQVLVCPMKHGSSRTLSAL